MTTDIQEITTGNQPVTQTDRELLLDVQARLVRLEGHLAALFSAWDRGGLRGLRQAAKGRIDGRPANPRAPR